MLPQHRRGKGGSVGGDSRRGSGDAGGGGYHPRARTLSRRSFSRDSEGSNCSVGSIGEGQLRGGLGTKTGAVTTSSHMAAPDNVSAWLGHNALSHLGGAGAEAPPPGFGLGAFVAGGVAGAAAVDPLERVSSNTSLASDKSDKSDEPLDANFFLGPFLAEGPLATPPLASAVALGGGAGDAADDGALQIFSRLAISQQQHHHHQLQQQGSRTPPY